ncbi:MAG: hypothetical protein OEO21_03625 [Candidatus Krumholzibacteria bacterium]|nr:hypothetical protein [Candidatus Krumholzibacteria bacterium]
MISIRFLRSLLVIVIACGAAQPARALVRFDFEQKYFSELGYPVLDHYLFQKNGLFHLYYLRGNPAVNIGHATSADLVHWTLQPPILQPGPAGSFDAKALWAPHLWFSGSTWFLYYTGVNSANSQETGVALSVNLVNWSKLPWPMYHPDPAWAEWSPDYFTHGRDPHVFAYGGKYYMLLTAKTNTNKGAVACAESPDLVNWTDIGPLYVHDTWHVMESVFLKERAGKFHMFFTEETVFGTSHMSSDSLFSGWDISNRRLIDTGHAAQVSLTEGGEEIFSRHNVYNDNHGLFRYVIRFDTLSWTSDIPAPYKPWPLEADWDVVTGNAFPFQPTFGNNPYVRNEDVAATYEGDCWVGTYEAYSGPMGFGFPGGIQGEARTGIMRSRTFSLTAKSISLLVGGGDFPDECYVALVDAATGAVLFKETGRNDDEMDRRYWDTRLLTGRSVYVEIADLSTAAFGHINVDDIVESNAVVGPPLGSSEGGTKKRVFSPPSELSPLAPAAPRLEQNRPNPFNPTTVIAYETPRAGMARIDIYDADGALVRRLVDGVVSAGAHSASWDGTDVHGRRVVSGVYFYRYVFDGEIVRTRKMTVVK